MQEDQTFLTVVLAEVLQLLLQDVQQLKARIEALESHANGIDNWTEKYSKDFAYVAQRVKALGVSLRKIKPNSP